MRLKDKPLSFVVNFLLGVAWASAFIGAISTFSSYYSNTLLFAFIAACFATLPGLVGVLLIEYFIISKEKHDELQKQTKLLEKLLNQSIEDD